MPIGWEATATAEAGDPSTIANIWEWWEPSRGSFSDNDLIGTLAGQFAPGTGHNFTQSTSGERPVYKASILNGLGVVRFNGLNQWLHNVDPSSLTGAHVFIVVKSSSNSASAGQGGLWSGAIGNPRYGYSVGKIGESIFRSPAIVDVTSGFDLSLWRVYEVLSVVGEFRMRIDGTSIFNDGGNFATYTDQRLGKNDIFFTEWFNGDVAGMYIFSAKLTTGRSLMVTYLNERFGLSIS